MDGLLLVLAAVLYTAAVIRTVRKERAEAGSVLALEGPETVALASRSAALDLILLGLGIPIVVLGASWLVEGAVELARMWEVSEALIGLTVVAIGTSSPELVTTIVSTLRNQRDIAIGNLLGSSAYNILAILGVTCLVPRTPVPVPAAVALIDLPVMMTVALACVPVFYTGREVTRAEGGVFVGAYAAYLSYLIIVRT